MPLANSTEEVLQNSVENAKKFMDLKSGDIVIVTGGYPNNDDNRTTNLMKIEEI